MSIELLAIKAVNYSHLFPTRYTLELEGLKGTVSSETFREISHREDAKKTVKKLLEERYQSGKNKWFFQPLRVRISSLVNSHCMLTPSRPTVLSALLHYFHPSPLLLLC
jgi:large subunit ribosomal protein L27e